MRRMDSMGRYMVGFFALAVCAILVFAVAGGFTDPNGAKRAVEALGMTDFVSDGYAFFGCDENDLVHTRFHAKNVHGQTVSGVVCSAPMKNSTVRLD